MKGIEPSYAAWEAAVLPLNYTREAHVSVRVVVASSLHGVKPSTGVFAGSGFPVILDQQINLTKFGVKYLTKFIFLRFPLNKY